ncbi:MAG: hypothetical protein Q8920_14415 [Bacillota bacterium]|nr:hypothetical protein [Bacillota bacterium]
MKKKKNIAIDDERLISLQKRYGFEALIVVTVLLVVDFIYRIIVLKQAMSDCWDVYMLLVAPWCYYTVRGTASGVFSHKNRYTKWIHVIKAVVIILILGPYTIGLIRDSVFSEIHSYFIFGLGVLVGLAMVFAILYSAKRIAKKAEKKIED